MAGGNATKNTATIDLRLPKERVVVSQASPWKRFAAFFIDILIVQISVIWPFSAAIENRIPISSDFMDNYNFISSNPGITEQLYLILGIVFFLVFIYFALFEYILRQTPGKIVFGLYVVTSDKTQEISMLKIIARNLAFLPVFPLSLLWIIDPLFLIFTGRRLSDIFSKTIVVEEIKV